MTYIAPVPNKISSENSSTTALNAGQDFTGAWVDATKYDSVVVAAKTDQDGLFRVQFSPDGVNVDSSLTRYYRAGEIEAPHRFTIARQYVRVKFENTSASNQTVLRLQTILGQKELLNAPIDGVLSRDYDAIPTRPTKYNTEVAQGLRQGHQLWNKFGYNSDIDLAAAEVIWAYGGSFTRMTSAETLDLVSDSANDAAAGTGVQQVVITGIDANWDPQTEIIALNGLTPVTTTNTWLGVNRLEMYVVGTGEVNAGNITVDSTTSGDVQAYMPAGEGVTQQCVFHVPRNTQFITEWLYLGALKITGAGGSPRVTFKMWVYSDVSGGKQEVFRTNMDTDVENHIDISPNLPFPIGEKSVVYLEASTDTNNTEVVARFSGILVKDVDA